MPSRNQGPIIATYRDEHDQQVVVRATRMDGLVSLSHTNGRQTLAIVERCAACAGVGKLPNGALTGFVECDVCESTGRKLTDDERHARQQAEDAPYFMTCEHGRTVAEGCDECGAVAYAMS